MIQRSAQVPDYRRRWGERFGYVPVLPERPRIWLHAVSVGEFNAAQPLIAGLRERFPTHDFLITTTTPTGSQRVQAAFADELANGQIQHCYLPFDTPGAIKRFFLAVKPSLGIIMETEVWPNLFRGARSASVPLLLANARLSERSMRGYAKIPAGFLAETLAAIAAIAAQSKQDGERWVELGVQADRVTPVGNIKFDQELDSEISAKGKALRDQWGAERPVWIAASTHQGEDEIILAAHRQVLAENPDALLILVPRHPDRFEDVARLVSREKFSLARRSAESQNALEAEVFLGDTLGEMMLFFAASDVAFVAGSLKDIGGHNLIEPAALGLPVLSGPYLHNFAQVRDWLLEADALKLVDDAESLATTVRHYFDHPGDAIAQGHAAQAVAEQNRGALDRLLELIQQLLDKPQR